MFGTDIKSMRKIIVLVWLLPILFFFCHGFPSIVNAQGIPIVFDLPAGVDPAKVFIQIVNTDQIITGTYRDNTGTEHSLAINTPYSMAGITSPLPVGAGAPANKPAVYITDVDSGRIFISFGKGLEGLKKGYEPDPGNATDPNYRVRYQFVEVTIKNSKLTGNLTYMDYVSIPISLHAVNAPTAKNNPLETTADGRTLVKAVAATGLTANNNVLPSPGDILPSANFARVISPGKAMDKYHDWTNYLRTFFQGKTVSLQGCFVGVGDQPTGNPLTQAQSYDFSAAFDAYGNVTLTARSGSGNGSSDCVPVVQRGTGVGDVNQTVTITFERLNSAVGIYGNNPAYTINRNGAVRTTAGIENDYFGRVVGDLLAGLSWGFPGSTVSFNGNPIGDLASTQWWGNARMPGGTYIPLANTPVGQNIVFEKAQPGQTSHYHTYAAGLNGLTMAYGFGLQDRPGNNLLEFNTATDPNSYLLITINPDHAKKGINSVYLLLLGN